MAALSCHVGAQSPPRRVIVVMVPGLRADDLTSSLLPMLQTLRSEGAAGWMVCRAARTTNRALLRSDGRDKAASLALTLGSGSRALAVEGQEGERRKAKGERDAVNTVALLSSLRVLNASVDHAVAVGALGDMVHARGWQTAVLGDADTTGRDEGGRMLAMDGRGNVDVMPAALRLNHAAPNAPYGVRDDVDAVMRELRRLPPRIAFVVVVVGDLARADAYAPLCLPGQSRVFRADALRELNTLLTQLRQQASNPLPPASAPSDPVSFNPVSLPPVSAAPASKTRPMPGSQNDTNDTMDSVRLIVLASAPAESSDVTDRIAPILVWGKGIVPGVLTSPSTRLPGVVVNTDFLPSVAAALGLPAPHGEVGRPFGVLPANMDALATSAWRAQHDRLLLSEHLKDVYGGLPTGQTLLILAAWWAWRKRHSQNGLRWTRVLAAAVVALPLGMLLLPVLPFASGSVGAAGVALTLWTLLFMIVAGWKNADADRAQSRARTLLRGMFAVLLTMLTLDLVTGSHLLRQAWMSYSVMETARFYGIGNEYMGAAIGAACVLSGARGQGSGGRQRVTMLLSSVFYLLLVLVLGYNRFGAKVGAIPSAGCALGVTLLVLWRGRVRGRDVLVVLAGSLLLLGGLAWLDARHSIGEQSHLARSVGGGLGGLLQIARRKLLLEGYLLLHSPWSAALCSASLLFGLLTRTGQKMPPEKRARTEPTGSKRTDAETIQELLITKAITTEEIITEEIVIKARKVRRYAVTMGLVAGAIVSLVCNDSGVTAAALIMLFGCAWMLTELAATS